MLLWEKGERAELFPLLSRWSLSWQCLLGRRIASHDRLICCLRNEEWLMGAIPVPMLQQLVSEKGSEDTEKFRELSPCPWSSLSGTNLVGSGWGWLAGLPVWADHSRGRILGVAKKKKSEKCAFLNWKFSICVCSLLEEPLHCSGTCRCSSKQGVMLSHRALLVQSVRTWPGHFMVLLEEESDNLLLMLYKAWACWTRISLKNNVWPEKNKGGIRI